MKLNFMNLWEIENNYFVERFQENQRFVVINDCVLMINVESRFTMNQ